MTEVLGESRISGELLARLRSLPRQDKDHLLHLPEGVVRVGALIAEIERQRAPLPNHDHSVLAVGIQLLNRAADAIEAACRDNPGLATADKAREEIDLYRGAAAEITQLLASPSDERLHALAIEVHERTRNSDLEPLWDELSPMWRGVKVKAVRETIRALARVKTPDKPLPG